MVTEIEKRFLYVVYFILALLLAAAVIHGIGPEVRAWIKLSGVFSLPFAFSIWHVGPEMKFKMGFISGLLGGIGLLAEFLP